MASARRVGVLLLICALPLACDDDDAGSGTNDGDAASGDATGGGDLADATGGDLTPGDAQSDAPGGDAQNDIAPDGAPPTIPDPLYLYGYAEGEDAEIGESAICNFFGQFIPETQTETGWTGIATGEVCRDIFREDGRNGLHAQVGGPATLTFTETGIELRWVGDQSEAGRFWRSMEVLEAEPTGEWMYAGEWACGPVDIDEPGWSDTQLIVDGTWDLGPEVIERPASCNPVEEITVSP